MNWYVERMEKHLSEMDKKFLKEIYEPITVMHRPPDDAYNTVAVTADGEIRVYGRINCADLGTSHNNGTPMYYSSYDCGLSWKLKSYDPQTQMGKGILNPETGRVFRLENKNDDKEYSYIRMADSHDSTDIKFSKLPGRMASWVRPAIILENGRVLIPGQEDGFMKGHSIFAYSDDNGETWELSHIEPTPEFKLEPPHKGIRWENSGLEPAVLELGNGNLMAMLRTSQDYNYVSYSSDYGTTWTKPEPSDFHATLTTSGFLKLNDGRVLFFWNNNKPLPEQDMEKVFPPLGAWEKDGWLEDVFTNRDANCIAISEDNGKTWSHIRELCLNECRNRADFRVCDGNRSSRDKSVQQCQMFELPFGKVLIHLGQNRLMSKVMIFDVNWLYEKTRKEDFRSGLDALTTHVFVKSISAEKAGQVGHDQWNRTNGALLIPNPDGDYSEVLLIRNTNDDILWNNMQGAVWNFPSGKSGEVNIKLRVLGKGLRISILDYLMNVQDETVKDFANFSFEITETDKDSWTDATIKFSGDTASLYLNGELKDTKKMVGTANNGLCYLHLQTLTAEGDSKGSLIKEVYAKVE